MAKISIYSDASFSKREGIAVLGFATLKGEGSILASNDIQLSVVSEVNNIRAEIRAAISALKIASVGDMVVLYTDCQNIVGLSSRRQKLEQSNYMSQRTSKILANADLYREIFVEFDRVNPTLIWIKGHSKTSMRSEVQSNFALLDKTVRKKLRESVPSQ